MKFLCDQMLGTLATWLRLFGFDTFYANAEMDDDNLLDIAKKEGRIVISRDKELIAKGRKEGLKVIEITSTDLDEQLKIILRDVEIDKKAVLSRCSLCNNSIIEIKKDEVKNRVPEKVFKNNEKFWHCSKCDKIYWAGSHYNRIISKLDGVKKLH